jgi:hypothetical protein
VSGDELMGFLRAAGGVLLSVGAVVMLERKTGTSASDKLQRTLIAGVPSILLYTLAIGALDRPSADAREPWRSVLLVSSLLLAPIAMLVLLRWLGADTGSALWDAGVLVAVALLAGYASQRAGVAYAALLAALAALLAWLLIWDELLGQTSVDTVRALLLVAGALLLLAAARLAREHAVGAGEVATAGAIAAILAGVVGVFVGVFATISGRLFDSLNGARAPSGRSPDGGSGLSSMRHTSALQGFGWNLYLLLASLALVWLGARARVRGLGYVGAVGLVVFALSVGARIGEVESAGAPGLGSWPVVLVVLGALALLLPAFARRER